MQDFRSMSDEEFVDFGFKTKTKYDQLDKLMAEVKAEARERASKKKVDHFFGHKNFLTVAPSSSTEVDCKELYDTYLDLGNEEQFFNVVKPMVGQAKKDLGETVFSTIAHVETKPYNTVSFKESVPKKYQKEASKVPSLKGK